MTSEIYLGSPEESIVSWIKNVWLLTIPFYIEVLEGGKDGNVKLVKKGSPDEISLLYSFDNKNWSDWDYTTGTDLNVGEKLYLKSKTNNGSFSNGESSYYTFNCLYGSKVNVCGNIMSLLYNDFVDKKELKDIGVFYRLFYECYPVTDASNLVLPATTLTEQCYRYMFYYCYNLIAAPELPATTLAQYCYWSMFENCTSLTSAPELPATTIAQGCYAQMFSRCTSLTSVPKLPATIVYKHSYYCMFGSCTSLTTAPELPATTLAYECYHGMFVDCASLTSIPKLPAITLTEGCYQYMFQRCTSLTSTPELPVTTLKQRCYQAMFYGCTSLTLAPKLPATTLANYCYRYLFYNCSNILELHYPKSIENDSTFKSITGSPWFGATNATVYYDL